MHSTSITPKIGAVILVLLTGAATSGCYELQAAYGEAALLAKREPIARVIADPTTAPALRRQLQEVTAMRDFASRDLALPDNGSYRSYVRVDGRSVVWNVFAAPEFSVEPKRWCYPFVGCVAYRGYFKRSRALDYARRLRADGMDVSVRGAAAYSTLGHFDDPILSTMTGWSDADLAAIVFHELTHQLLYVPGDTEFNEGLATFVEREGVSRWLVAQGRSRDLAEYSAGRRRYRKVIRLLIGTRRRLRELYRSGVGKAAMRAQKRAEFAALRASYLRLRPSFGPHAPLADWFNGEINNADLVSISTYEQCVPGFAHELKLAGGDLRAFIERIRKIAKLNRAARDAAVCGRA